MKIFISWSGELSKILAEELRLFIKLTINATEPFFSKSDIEKGERFFTHISKELENSNYCLICLTRDNVTAPWIMFEAGAISKNLEKSKICPILFNISPSDLQGPLIQFQACDFNKDEFWNLFLNINKSLGVNALELEYLKPSFENNWLLFSSNINKQLKRYENSSPIPLRETRDILNEILEGIRHISKVYSIKQNHEANLFDYKLINEIYKALNSKDISVQHAPKEGIYSVKLSYDENNIVIDFNELEKIINSISSDDLSTKQKDNYDIIKYRVFQIAREIFNIANKVSFNQL